MAATLLHSDLTLLMALIDSSRVDREVKANFSNCSSKLYAGMSSIVPKTVSQVASVNDGMLRLKHFWQTEISKQKICGKGESFQALTAGESFSKY